MRRAYLRERSRPPPAVGGVLLGHTQVPVTVTHNGFAKEHRLDLVGDDALYELKTANAFVPQHDAQALHYAMLALTNLTAIQWINLIGQPCN